MENCWLSRAGQKQVLFFSLRTELYSSVISIPVRDTRWSTNFSTKWIFAKGACSWLIDPISMQIRSSECRPCISEISQLFLSVWKSLRKDARKLQLRLCYRCHMWHYNSVAFLFNFLLEERTSSSLIGSRFN